MVRRPRQTVQAATTRQKVVWTGSLKQGANGASSTSTGVVSLFTSGLPQDGRSRCGNGDLIPPPARRPLFLLLTLVAILRYLYFFYPCQTQVRATAAAERRHDLVPGHGVVPHLAGSPSLQLPP